MYGLIDTHAHLDEVEDLDRKLEEAREAGVIAVIAVGANERSNVRTLEIAQQHSGFVYPALGLLPWEVGSPQVSGISAGLRFIEQNISDAVAVGEIGMDYDRRVRKVASRELQRETFLSLLDVAKRTGRPAIVHSRYAWKDALQAVQDVAVERVVFHWFTGFSSVLDDIIAGGHFVSATPASEYHEEHRRAVREAPLERLLLETDCPVSYGREIRYQSRPADIVKGLKAVSQLKGVDEAEVAEQTTTNAAAVFSLPIAC